MHKLTKLLTYFLAIYILTTGKMSHANEFYVLPEVVVTGTYEVDFDNYGGYSPFFDPFSYFHTELWNYVESYAGTAHEAAVLAEISSILKKANVCYALVSTNARSTTSHDDVTSRWLAAQEVFNYLNNASYLTTYREMLGNITFRIDGKLYEGFKVTYADGVTETWPINPGYRYSTIKLLEQPMPNSQKPWQGNELDRCNQGQGIK